MDTDIGDVISLARQRRLLGQFTDAISQLTAARDKITSPDLKARLTTEIVEVYWMQGYYGKANSVAKDALLLELDWASEAHGLLTLQVAFHEVLWTGCYRDTLQRVDEVYKRHLAALAPTEYTDMLASQIFS